MPNPDLAGAVIRVGHGRGFVVKSPRGVHERLVITAAHCLPRFIAAQPARYEEERTYRKLLAPLGARPSIAAACAFVDPVADIAVLDRANDDEAFLDLTDE